MTVVSEVCLNNVSVSAILKHIVLVLVILLTLVVGEYSGVLDQMIIEFMFQGDVAVSTTYVHGHIHVHITDMTT
jgi:hypothetical protein